MTASRFAALGLLLAVLALPWLGVALPLLDSFAEGERDIAELSAKAERLAAAAAAKDEWLAQKEALAARRERGGLLLAGASEALAAAALQNTIKTAVARAGGELRSTQPLTTSEEKGFRRIAVRALLTTDAEGLRTLLHAVDAARPLLFVEALEVRGRAVSRRDGEPEEPQLDIRIDVTGFAPATGGPP